MRLVPLIATAVLLAACANAPATEAACTVAQPVILPLEPLEIVTPDKRVKFMVEVADSDPERTIGMMCRTSMAADRGMLFDFKGPQKNVAFWMRNTIIPLDIVYIAPDGRVLSIARNAKPLDERPLPAGGTIRGVLELRGGRAAELGILPGDRVLHRIFPRG